MIGIAVYVILLFILLCVWQARFSRAARARRDGEKRDERVAEFEDEEGERLDRLVNKWKN